MSTNDLFHAPYHSFIHGKTPGSAKAKCNRCGEQFDYIPAELNSTIGSYPEWNRYPKCPVCHSWRDTIIMENR